VSEVQEKFKKRDERYPETWGHLGGFLGSNPLNESVHVVKT